MQNQKLKVFCRPARESDTADVVELTRTIWDGHDYVPHVWASWLADPQGLLAVAEYQGRVLGLGKLTHLAPHDWWIEGLRVHPEYEGRGIASQLHDYLVDYWLEGFGGVLRLATASFRYAVHHLSERTGFQKIGEFTMFGAPALAEPVEHFSPLRVDEVHAAFDFAQRSEIFGLAAHLIDLGWEWASLYPFHIEESLQAGMAWRSAAATIEGSSNDSLQGLLLARPDSEEEVKTLAINLLACEMKDLTTCLLDFRRLAAMAGFEHAAWSAPIHPDLPSKLEAAGFQREWDASVYVYAREHPSKLAQKF